MELINGQKLISQLDHLNVDLLILSFCAIKAFNHPDVQTAT